MKVIVVLISLLSWIQLSAQEEKVFFPTEERKIEVGLNVTSVISSFVGSNDGNIDPGSFPLVVKFAKNNKAWRLGLGIDFKSSEDNSLVFFGQNRTSTASVFTKVGREWRHQVGKRVLAYYGVDLLANYASETSDVFTSTDFVALSLTDFGFGGGPIYGLQVALNERILLSFEGSFYGIVTHSRIKEEFQQNPIFNRDETTWLTDIEMNMPQWLYLVVRF